MIKSILTRIGGGKVDKKQITKKTYFVPVNKFTLITMFLISGMVWCPLSMVYSLKDPVRAHYLLAKIGMGGLRLHYDVMNALKRTYYTMAPDGVLTMVDRYNLDSLSNLPAEAVGYKQPPMNYRLTKGAVSAMKGAI